MANLATESMEYSNTDKIIKVKKMLLYAQNIHGQTIASQIQGQTVCPYMVNRCKYEEELSRWQCGEAVAEEEQVSVEQLSASGLPSSVEDATNRCTHSSMLGASSGILSFGKEMSEHSEQVNEKVRESK